jgi:hypothetical protein
LAHKAKHAGNVTNANRLFTSSALRFLSIAVTEYAHIEHVLVFAMQEGLPALLAAVAQTTEEMIGEVRSGRVPRAALSDRYVLLALSHFATLLRAHDSANTLCRIAESREVTGTPFWDAYAVCYGRFCSGTDFAVPALSLRTAEKYWMPYLELMNAIVRRESSETIVEGLRVLFLKRNNDKRFSASDAHQIEGTWNQPARWDFRLEALLVHSGTRA